MNTPVIFYTVKSPYCYTLLQSSHNHHWSVLINSYIMAEYNNVFAQDKKSHFTGL